MVQSERMPKVSVCVITYNHEKYIRQCLQSIVDQETDFDFEIIVGDDCSTDGTRGIVEEFARRYPSKVVPVLYPDKVGGTQNYLTTHNQARGMYVAHIDGDDMALPGKLQIQADYLDKNADCSVVWHRLYLFNEDEGYCIANEPDLTLFSGGKIYLQDILTLGSVVYHSSMMYRASARKTRESSGDVMDWYYTVEFLASGYGKYLDSILGKYRRNNIGGLSSGTGAKKTRMLYVSTLNKYFSVYPQFHKEIFINCCISFMVDVKNFRSTAFYFIPLALRAFNFVYPQELFIAFTKLQNISKLEKT